MKSHVEFLSDSFPAEPGEDEKVNPGRWGKKLAEYLRVELDRVGLNGGEVFPEDWGWVVPIENEAFALWVGCGNRDGHPNGFLCFVEPSKPIVRRLFRKIDASTRVTEVADALDKILTTNQNVREIHWWPDSGAVT